MRRWLTGLGLCLIGPWAQAADRPNILWITAEDHGPHLGCYGDSYATTPNLDALAKRGMLFNRAWSNAPVCAPARTTIITGMYPPSTGAEHMRSAVPLPAGVEMYPTHLKNAGYYCTNNSKTDYNIGGDKAAWAESSNKAHWKNRPAGQPFFAIFNNTGTHESQVRKRPHQAVHDPAKVPLPAYHPDAPEVRQDWAQYHDNITQSDTIAAKLIQEIADAGLADDTIIFYFADHGPGMPRCKRTPYNSGLHVPMIVYFPDKFKHLAPKEYQTGGKSDRLVSFVDLAPTLLSIVGAPIPEHMQGYAFAGPKQTPPQPFIHGFRGRMDERYDTMRSTTDGRYVYVRHYHPHLPFGQHVQYMFETPTTQVWKRLFDEGKLNDAQARFWKTKPTEELFDLTTDPHEVNNIVDRPEMQPVLVNLRHGQMEHERRIKDVGLLPEAEMHRRWGSISPYDGARQSGAFDFDRLWVASRLATAPTAGDAGKVVPLLTDTDSGVRYWGAMGLLIRGAAGGQVGRTELTKVLTDESPSVRIAAAEALARAGDPVGVTQLVKELQDEKATAYALMEALNALDRLEVGQLKSQADLPSLLQVVKGRADWEKSRGGTGVNRLVASVEGRLGVDASQPAGKKGAGKRNKKQ